jgi:hypothetical protein
MDPYPFEPSGLNFISKDLIGYWNGIITRWLQLNYLCYNIVYWSFKNKFIDELYQS